MRRTIPLLNLIFATVSLSLVALLLSPFDRRGEKVNKLGRLWATLHLKTCGIRISLQGAENLSDPPYIIMCNHQSTLDIFALLSSVRLPFKWIAKKELFSVPFLGWALKAGRNIPMDRTHPRKALTSVNMAARMIQEGMNIIIFPEGTWSTDGVLLPFKKGGFSLAQRTGVPIVPVGIKGTGPLQPEGCFLPRGKGTIEIRIGTPIPVVGKGPPARSRLLHEVRSHIERLAGT